MIEMSFFEKVPLGLKTNYAHQQSWLSHLCVRRVSLVFFWLHLLMKTSIQMLKIWSKHEKWNAKVTSNTTETEQLSRRLQDNRGCEQ